MSAPQLLVLSVIVYGIGAVASLLLGNRSSARRVSGLAGLIAGLVGLGVAIGVLVSGSGFTLEMPRLVPWARFLMACDSLAAFMVGVISLLAVATSIYSLSYLDHYDDRGVGVM
jgi:hydrogenase-4 component B